jgi:cytochrome c1
LAFQFPATDIPSSSIPPMFQPTFNTTTEEHLGWDQMEFCDVLATLDSPQQAEEVGASQFTQAPPVWTQPAQPQGGATTVDGGATMAGGATPAAGGAIPAGGATPAGGGATPAGGATPDVAGSSQAAMATPSPDQLGPRVVRTPDPWTYDRDQT